MFAPHDGVNAEFGKIGNTSQNFPDVFKFFRQETQLNGGLYRGLSQAIVGQRRGKGRPVWVGGGW